MPKIELRNVVVDFPIYNTDRIISMDFLKTLTGGIINRNSNSKTVIIRALDDISLSIKTGDRLGIIGHNGAGKSTLLRILAGIYYPTAGDIQIEGSVSQLFDISLGISFDDTGYENIKNIGRYFGMTKKQIVEITPKIAELTELGDFLNLPVRTYSTGMLTRLSFAIATSIEPDILLLDEGLGAGDARFADKVKERVDGLLERSSLLVLASHSEGMIQNMCNKAILLEKGKMVHMGEVDDVIERYHELNKAMEQK